MVRSSPRISFKITPVTLHHKLSLRRAKNMNNVPDKAFKRKLKRIRTKKKKLQRLDEEKKESKNEVEKVEEEATASDDDSGCDEGMVGLFSYERHFLQAPTTLRCHRVR